MADVNQTVVEASPPVEGGPGSTRNEANLVKAFPNSPIYSGELDDTERKEVYQTSLDGIVLNGLGISSFNLDFSEAPNIEDVETGGGGLPGTPYIPNLNSADGASPAGLPPYDGTLGSVEDKAAASGRQYGSGLGGLVSPKTTAEEISTQKIGDLIASNGAVGSKSYPGSTG
jgi:hypothetical protein